MSLAPPPVAPAVRLVAVEAKTTYRPSSEIAAPPLSPFPSPPVAAEDSRTTAPVAMSFRKTSVWAALPPAGPRLVAADAKTTYRPSSERSAPSEAASAGVPSAAAETSCAGPPDVAISQTCRPADGPAPRSASLSKARKRPSADSAAPPAMPAATAPRSSRCRFMRPAGPQSSGSREPAALPNPLHPPINATAAPSADSVGPIAGVGLPAPPA